MGEYKPKKVFYDQPRIEKDPTPYHRFMRERKESRILLQINTPQEGYKWGYDERSIRHSLGTGCEYYYNHMGTEKKHTMALVLGTAMYAFRGMMGLGPICWITEFLAGLLQIRFGIGLVIPVAVLWRIGCWIHFDDSFMIRFVKMYKKTCPVYQPISSETDRIIHKRLRENPSAAAAYLILEVFVVGVMLALESIVRG